MVRRWSRITTNDVDFASARPFYFRYTYKSFRKSIIFKRFSLRYTRFDRQQLSGIKHNFNWTIYSQIWQNWVQDFSTIKSLVKFQYFKKFNNYEILSFDPFHYNTKKSKLQLTVSEFLNCYVSRKLIFLTNKFYTIAKNNFTGFKSFFKNFASHFSYLPYTSLDVLTNSLPLPLMIDIDGEFYDLNLVAQKQTKLNFNLEVFFVQLNTISYLKIKETYSILTLLWINLILNVK